MSAVPAIAVPMLTDAECRRSQDPDAGLGALKTAKGNLPLEAVDVRAGIVGLLAEMTLTQTFVNTLKVPLEATYVFPLPDRAAVTRFRFQVKERVIEGVLKERGEAREEYDRAIADGHRAAIAEEERPGVFTMRVGNLMPGEKATVTLSLTGPLPFEDGEATFRFPLVVAPRYIPGSPLSGDPVGDGVAEDTDAVPDASRISPPVLLPGFPSPVRLSLSVEVDPAGLPLDGVRSSLHAIAETRGEKRTVRLLPNERLDRDFILRLSLAEDAVRTSLVLKADADGQGGTFALTLVPPQLAVADRPRDVIFVLDRSGSMEGWKMVAARRAVARMVDTLCARDRFGVLAFDDSIETPPELSGALLCDGTDRNRFRAVEFLAKVDARGGTEMAAPLVQAASALAGGYDDRERVLVLVTDGQVGNEDQILRELGSRVKNVRVFTVGIDRAVNEAFLRRLAAQGGGGYELVESEDRLDDAMERIHARIGTPILTELHVEGDGLAVQKDSIVPARLPALFAGAPVVISGRYLGRSGGAVALAARDAAGATWQEKVPAALSNDPAVASIYGRGRVRDLEDAYAAGRTDLGDLEKKIVEVSLKFGVLCRFTAFVAVDRSEIVNRGGANQKVTQPVDAPSGWDMFQDEGAAEEPTGSHRLTRASVMKSAAPASPAPMEAEADLKEEAAPSRVMDSLSSAAPSRRQAGKGGGVVSSAASAVGHAAKKLSQAMKPKPAGPAGRTEEAKRDRRPEPAPFDLAPYRARVLALAELMKKEQSGDEKARRFLLGQVKRLLEALVADMASTGAGEDAVLAGTLAGLATLLSPAKVDLASLWAATLEGLSAFAEGGGPTPPGPTAGTKKAFWKR